MKDSIVNFVFKDKDNKTVASLLNVKIPCFVFPVAYVENLLI